MRAISYSLQLLRVIAERLSKRDVAAVVLLLSRQLHFAFTTADMKIHVEHPLLLRVVVLLQYTDGVIHSGGMQPQRLGTAVQRHHHLITSSEPCYTRLAA